MKIYNKITLAWNEETQRYDDVVYEDSFEYDGEIEEAMPIIVTGIWDSFHDEYCDDTNDMSDNVEFYDDGRWDNLDNNDTGTWETLENLQEITLETGDGSCLGGEISYSTLLYDWGSSILYCLPDGEDILNCSAGSIANSNHRYDIQLIRQQEYEEPDDVYDYEYETDDQTSLILDATGTIDPNNDDFTCTWEFVSTPQDTLSTLNVYDPSEQDIPDTGDPGASQTNCYATFIPADYIPWGYYMEYIIQLTATDSFGANGFGQSTVTMLITVTGTRLEELLPGEIDEEDIITFPKSVLTYLGYKEGDPYFPRAYSPFQGFNIPQDYFWTGTTDSIKFDYTSLIYEHPTIPGAMAEERYLLACINDDSYSDKIYFKVQDIDKRIPLGLYYWQTENIRNWSDFLSENYKESGIAYEADAGTKYIDKTEDPDNIINEQSVSELFTPDVFVRSNLSSEQNSNTFLVEYYDKDIQQYQYELNQAPVTAKLYFYGRAGVSNLNYLNIHEDFGSNYTHCVENNWTCGGAGYGLKGHQSTANAICENWFGETNISFENILDPDDTSPTGAWCTDSSCNMEHGGAPNCGSSNDTGWMKNITCSGGITVGFYGGWKESYFEGGGHRTLEECSLGPESTTEFDNFVYNNNCKTFIPHSDRPQLIKAYQNRLNVAFLDWGDGETEYFDEPHTNIANIPLTHTYNNYGVYKITGTMFWSTEEAEAPSFESQSGDAYVWSYKKFELNISINKNIGYDDEFKALGGEDYNFIPHDETIPVVSGITDDSSYFKHISFFTGWNLYDRSWAPISENVEHGYRMRLETALAKFDSSLIASSEIGGTLVNYTSSIYSGSIDSSGQIDFTNQDSYVINSGSLHNTGEFGDWLGFSDIGQVRAFTKPLQMYDMLGFDAVDAGNPGHERYWKNIIPENYSINNRYGISLDITQFPQIAVSTINGSNIVSLPCEVEDNLYTSVFPDAIEGTFLNFDQTPVSDDRMEMGKAYWLNFTSGTVTNVQCSEPVFSLQIELDEGWTSIGSISGIVNFSDIIDPSGIIVPGSLYEFDGTYVDSSTIEPGKGYQIRTYEAGQVTLIFMVDNFIDESSSQEWLGTNEYGNTYYYPVLPKLSRGGAFYEDLGLQGSVTQGDGSDKIPFGAKEAWDDIDLDAPITQTEIEDETLKCIIDLDFSGISDESLEDNSGGQNLGMLIGDFGFDSEIIDMGGIIYEKIKERKDRPRIPIIKEDKMKAY